MPGIDAAGAAQRAGAGMDIEAAEAVRRQQAAPAPGLAEGTAAKVHAALQTASKSLSPAGGDEGAVPGQGAAVDGNLPAAAAGIGTCRTDAGKGAVIIGNMVFHGAEASFFVMLLL